MTYYPEEAANTVNLIPAAVTWHGRSYRRQAQNRVPYSTDEPCAQLLRAGLAEMGRTSPPSLTILCLEDGVTRLLVNQLLTDWRTQLGWYVKVETVADEAALTATIERYNELAAAGNDEDFGKRADRLFPVEEGPFYAYPLTDTVILVNMGGLQTDVDFNVMDTEDEVIEGLYAVGNAQGGRFLVDYPLPAPGISHGMALTHGMLVGRILAQL